MGNPMDGDIYEGTLRPGDIGLTEAEVEGFKAIPVEARIDEFVRRFREQDSAQAADESGATHEMPRYKCHKEVWALKIKAITYDVDEARKTNRETDGSATITPEEARYAPFKVNSAYLKKHKPEVGGYFVVYKDGYKSYSPARAFEEGYTRI